MIILLPRRDHPARRKACYPALVTAFCQYSSDQPCLDDAVEPELPPLAFVEVVAVEQGDAALHHCRLDPHRAAGDRPVGAAVADADRLSLEPALFDGAAHLRRGLLGRPAVV